MYQTTASNLASDKIVESSKVKPWLVCLSAGLFFFYEFVLMNMFNTISQDITSTFHLNATQFGYLASMSLFSNVLLLPIAGLMLDRFSTRKLILFSMFTCVIFTFIFTLSHTFPMALISRFLSGCSGAFCFLSCIMLASRWFPSQRLAFVTGIIVTMAFVGGASAQKPLSLLVEHVGNWRVALMYYCFFGFFLWSVMWCLVEDHPNKSLEVQKNKEKKYTIKGYVSHSGVATCSLQNWLCGLYTGSMNLIVFVIGAVYGSDYLISVHGVARADANTIIMMIYFGTIIGAPSLGMISDKINSRKQPMVLGAVVSLLLILPVIIMPGLPVKVLLTLFFLLGISTSAQVISYPLIVESNPPHLTGVGGSISSTIILFIGAICQPIFGVLMDAHWDGKLGINQLPEYANSD